MAEAWKDAPCRRLARLIDDAGLSNVEVGQRLRAKRSGPTVSRWKSGELTPNADTLTELLEMCGGSADEVLGLRPPVVDRAKLRQAVGLVVEVLDAQADSPGTRKREP